MDELIARITDVVGIEAETAEKAVTIILSFLRKEGPSDVVDELIAMIGGTPDALGDEASGGDAGGGLVGGLAGLVGGGGGVMAVLGQLQGIGLGMGEIQGVTAQTVEFAREKGGGDQIDAIVASIPGLSQFI